MNEKGFIFVEMLIVFFIILILFLIMILNVMKYN